ncbi:MAG: hypothetical protein A2026_09985 [Deltaproteobacteria bacterium RBG_19FT_COMBO_46_12]|nr:MAG: hypothetical protein A2026_09985 [Deltaproteobacteria bacterium RBG_19FT_COMBO_46_12]
MKPNRIHEPTNTFLIFIILLSPFSLKMDLIKYHIQRFSLYLDFIKQFIISLFVRFPIIFQTSGVVKTIQGTIQGKVVIP